MTTDGRPSVASHPEAAEAQDETLTDSPIYSEAQAAEEGEDLVQADEPDGG